MQNHRLLKNSRVCNIYLLWLRQSIFFNPQTGLVSGTGVVLLLMLAIIFAGSIQTFHSGGYWYLLAAALVVVAQLLYIRLIWNKNQSSLPG